MAIKVHAAAVDPLDPEIVQELAHASAPCRVLMVCNDIYT